MAARDSELALAFGLSKHSQAMRSLSTVSVHWGGVAAVFISPPSVAPPGQRTT
jgi:hypothetical protein